MSSEHPSAASAQVISAKSEGARQATLRPPRPYTVLQPSSRSFDQLFGRDSYQQLAVHCSTLLHRICFLLWRTRFTRLVIPARILIQ